jgi:predicted nucleotidyltransferase
VTEAVPERYPGEFVRVVIGSTIHGLSVAGTDDLDLMGICIEPPEGTLGMGKPFEQHVYRTQPEGHPSGPGDVDLTVYSLRKHLRLASNGNPTVLNLLFVPPDYRHLDGPLADDLRALTHFIVSREAGARYLGYAQAQRERLLGLRGQKHTGYTRRLKYQAEAGWDTKYGMHLCRLAVQGIELLSTGRITLPVPEPDRSKLMEVRRGDMTLEQVIEWSQQLELQLLTARDKSDLPEHPDRGALNDWLVATYLHEWGST